jgi:hypothetical protein
MLASIVCYIMQCDNMSIYRSFYITASCMPSTVLLHSALCKASQDDELTIRSWDITWFEVQISGLNHLEKVPAGEPCCSLHFPALFPTQSYFCFVLCFLLDLIATCFASNCTGGYPASSIFGQQYCLTSSLRERLSTICPSFQ